MAHSNQIGYHLLAMAQISPRNDLTRWDIEMVHPKWTTRGGVLFCPTCLVRRIGQKLQRHRSSEEASSAINSQMGIYPFGVVTTD